MITALLSQGLIRSKACCDGIPMCIYAGCNGLPEPQCPDEQGVTLKVYTRHNRNDGQEWTRHSMPSVFISNVLTVFIVHGWMQNETYTWMHEMKDAFLDQGNYNVIIVGWSRGASNMTYRQSFANTAAVGAEIALRANFTIKLGKTTTDDLYCVGHGVGAHVCGHAGRYSHFGRVTGLDPTDPRIHAFLPSRGCEINRESAKYVDIIHTNGVNSVGNVARIGMIRPRGHVDFYPNGGCDQPGCPKDFNQNFIKLEQFIAKYNDSSSLAAALTQACSHNRAYELFTESIREDCFRTSTKFHDFTECSKVHPDGHDRIRTYWNQQQSMGFYSVDYSRRGSYYLDTSAHSPFCRVYNKG